MGRWPRGASPQPPTPACLAPKPRAEGSGAGGAAPVPCFGCTAPMGSSPARDCHPARTVRAPAPAAPSQSCSTGQRLSRAAGTCKHQWETRTHLSLLQSCLDIALLALQGFLQLLQLMDGFAAQTDLVSQISNFLWQGWKGIWSGMSLWGQLCAGTSPTPCPGSADVPPDPWRPLVVLGDISGPCCAPLQSG